MQCGAVQCRVGGAGGGDPASPLCFLYIEFLCSPFVSSLSSLIWDIDLLIKTKRGRRFTSSIARLRCPIRAPHLPPDGGSGPGGSPGPRAAVMEEISLSAARCLPAGNGSDNSPRKVHLTKARLTLTCD